MKNTCGEGTKSLTNTVLETALETNRTIEELGTSVQALQGSVHSQLEHLEHISRNVDEGVSAMEAFANKAGSLASRIQEQAELAQHNRSRVQSLESDVHIMSRQAEESAVFLKELSKLVLSICDTSREIKYAAEDISVIAINTAIEAARAGERGRGFAVISREIRKLAVRSGTLSDSIVSMIQDASQKLSGIQESVAAAEQSSKSAAQTAQIFRGDFEQIATDTALASEEVSSFRTMATERVLSEKDIAEQVRGIRKESITVSRHTDLAASIALNLREATQRTLQAMDTSKSQHHHAALEAAKKLSSSIEPSSLHNQRQLDHLLELGFSGTNVFELLYIMDETGIQISSNIVRPDRVQQISREGYGICRSAKDYFAIPAKTQEAWVSAAYISSATGSLCITASVPLFTKSGSFAGILCADIDAAELSTKR